MVGRGAAMLAVAQLRILLNWPCSSWPNAESKNRAWRCQDRSLINGANGDSTDGGMPARIRAVSSALTASAARPGIAATSDKLKATATIFIDCSIPVSGPKLLRAD